MKYPIIMYQNEIGRIKTPEEIIDWWVNLKTLEAENMIKESFPKKNILNISHKNIISLYNHYQPSTIKSKTQYYGAR